MDKKQRKANEALKKSQDYLKMKSKQKTKVEFAEHIYSESAPKKAFDSWRKKQEVKVNDSSVSLSGKEISSSVAMMNINLQATSIQGKKSMLLKGQCVVKKIIQTDTGIKVYAVFAADGRYAVSFYNPTKL